MNKPLLSTKGHIYYKLLRKYLNLNRRIRAIACTSSRDDKKSESLLAKLLKLHARLLRMLRQSGVKIACTALVLILSETLARAQYIEFKSDTSPGAPLIGVDIGSYSAPAFADMDDDGDQDLFVGDISGNIRYYKYEGTTFNEQTGDANPMDAVAAGILATPTLVDIDDDGDEDLFIGNFNGTINYHKNTGTVLVTEFTAQTGANNPLNGVDIGDYSTPAFVDIDGDGDLDVFIGSGAGVISFYKNTGTDSLPIFTAQNGSNNPLDGVDVGQFSAPIFHDVDKDGDIDVLIGENQVVFFYQNMGSVTEPQFSTSTDWILPVNDIVIRPAFVDIDEDDDLDAFIGGGQGKLRYLENITTNYNNPTITSYSGAAEATVHVDENQLKVTTLVASDADADLITFAVTGGTDQSKFTVDETSGELTFIWAPDYDLPGSANADNDYQVEVTATDDGSGYLKDVQTLTVGVTDVVDDGSNPVITSNGGTLNVTIPVDENQSAVTTVTAKDADDDDISFAITGGADHRLFSIDQSSGVLAFKFAPDYEFPDDDNEDNNYQVEVTATDNSSAQLTAGQHITVSINDVVGDGSNPTISSNEGSLEVNIELDENEAKVTTVVASDADDDELSYMITGGVDQDLFSIDEATGSLIFKLAPDFETPGDTDEDNSYEVEIIAIDDSPNQLTDGQIIMVNVRNLNDNSPIITSNQGKSSVTIVVDENQTAVTTISATDGDNDMVSYAFAGGADQSQFSIDETSGVLVFKSAPDFEVPTDADTDNKYLLEVAAIDDGTEKRMTKQTLSIQVNNVDDDIVTGVGDSPTDRLLIYPNPSTSVIYIESKQELLEMNLYDLFGKRLMGQSLLSNGFTMDIGKLHDGIYVLQLKTEGGKVSQKIMKH